MFIFCDSFDMNSNCKLVIFSVCLSVCLVPYLPITSLLWTVNPRFFTLLNMDNENNLEGHGLVHVREEPLVLPSHVEVGVDCYREIRI